MRSVSLTLSSSASLITVTPWAWVARRAIIGNSSIKRGIKAPPISVPFKSEDSTLKVADLATGSISVTSNFPPMVRMTSIIPVRVSLMPTFLSTKREFGTIKPATSQKAALEISPGTITFCPVNFCGPWTVIFLPSTLK